MSTYLVVLCSECLGVLHEMNTGIGRLGVLVCPS